ncbi:MAG: helicase HerA-like domain-containing protein [Saprospiraceae bacterium]
MANTEKFIEEIEKGYTFKGKSFVLGGAMLDKTCQTNTLVRIPLKTLNRHGLIAGATGSGKTKTLQIIAEQLSNNGVPVLLMDVKVTCRELPFQVQDIQKLMKDMKKLVSLSKQPVVQ